ncbi:hypothetical protein AB4084_36040, partial [Lysobacter sp. 2RAB21]
PPTANSGKDFESNDQDKLTLPPDNVGGQPNRKKGNYLGAEQRYLAGNALNMSGVGEAITQRNFSAVIEEFKKDAAAESDAQDATRLYKSNFESIIGNGD